MIFSTRNFIKYPLPVMILVIAGSVFYSCTFDKAETQLCPPVTGTVSFQADIIPLFETHCSVAGCHSGSDPEGSLNLETALAYDELMRPGSGYINTVKPNFSVLYSQMISVSQPMPPNGNLDECSTNLVLKWIEQGAANN